MKTPHGSSPPRSSAPTPMTIASASSPAASAMRHSRPLILPSSQSIATASRPSGATPSPLAPSLSSSTPPGPSRKPGDRTGDPPRNMTADDVPWDNSNSQYGVLGVWSCAEWGIEIPGWYWKDVEKHWVTWQLKDGQWGYKKTDNLGSLAMTAAGIASLFVTADWNEPSQARIYNGREP